MIKMVILKLNLQIRTKAIDKLASFLYKYYFFSKTGFKYKKVFISAYYFLYAFFLFEYYKIRMVIILDT